MIDGYKSKKEKIGSHAILTKKLVFFVIWFYFCFITFDIDVQTAPDCIYTHRLHNYLFIYYILSKREFDIYCQTQKVQMLNIYSVASIIELYARQFYYYSNKTWKACIVNKCIYLIPMIPGITNKWSKVNSYQGCLRSDLRLSYIKKIKSREK